MKEGGISMKCSAGQLREYIRIICFEKKFTDKDHRFLLLVCFNPQSLSLEEISKRRGLTLRGGEELLSHLCREMGCANSMFALATLCTLKCEQRFPTTRTYPAEFVHSIIGTYQLHNTNSAVLLKKYNESGLDRDTLYYQSPKLSSEESNRCSDFSSWKKQGYISSDAHALLDVLEVVDVLGLKQLLESLFKTWTTSKTEEYMNGHRDTHIKADASLAMQVISNVKKEEKEIMVQAPPIGYACGAVSSSTNTTSTTIQKQTSMRVTGKVPVDLFSDYPELTAWLKSRRCKNNSSAFDVYNSIAAYIRSSGSIAKKEISMLQSEYSTKMYSESYISVQRCVSSFVSFMKFHKTDTKGRKNILEGINVQHKYDELLWALKYTCANDLNRALQAVALDYQEYGGVDQLKKTILLKKERVMVKTNGTVVEKEKKSKKDKKEKGESKKRKVVNVVEQTDRNTKPAKEKIKTPFGKIPVDLFSVTLAQAYPVTWDYLVKKGLDKVYDLVIKKCNLVSSKTLAVKLLSETIQDDIGVDMNISQLHYAIRQVQLLDWFLSESIDAQQFNIRNVVTNHSDYSLLALLRRIEFLKKDTPLQGNFWKKMLSIAQVIKNTAPKQASSSDTQDTPATPGQEAVESSESGSMVAIADFSLETAAFEEATATILALTQERDALNKQLDTFIIEKGEWRQRALDAETKNTVLEEAVKTSQNDLAMVRKRTENLEALYKALQAARQTT